MCVTPSDSGTALCLNAFLFYFLFIYFFLNPYTFLHLVLLQQARLEKMAEFQQKGDDLVENFAECKRLLEEAQGRLRAAAGRERDEESRCEAESLRAEVKRLEKDEESFEKMTEEHKRQEKKLPWNVDTMCKEGFSKVSCRAADTSVCSDWFPYAMFFFAIRVCLTSGLTPVRKLSRTEWRSTNPLLRNMQRKSSTLV